MRNNKLFTSSMVTLVMLLLQPLSVFAYIGPGAGISAIGSAIAFMGVILLLFIGFFWYPVKKFLHRNKAKAEEEEAAGKAAGKKVTQDDSDKARGL